MYRQQNPKIQGTDTYNIKMIILSRCILLSDFWANYLLFINDIYELLQGLKMEPRKSRNANMQECINGK